MFAKGAGVAGRRKGIKKAKKTEALGKQLRRHLLTKQRKKGKKSEHHFLTSVSEINKLVFHSSS